jgi:DNA-directed RNA polymerase beta subunit
MLPQEARLRNLTYASPLYLGVTKKIMEGREIAFCNGWARKHDSAKFKLITAHNDRLDFVFGGGESDGATTIMLPQEARLRNLTYASPLYLGVTKKIMEAHNGAQRSARFRLRRGGESGREPPGLAPPRALALLLNLALSCFRAHPLQKAMARPR